MNSYDVIFILTDDQRHDTIGALNNSQIRTPNLDKLVGGGTWCDQAFIMGGTCPAVCMPSRAMVHTGRHLFHLENSGESIPSDHVLWGEFMRSHGYETCGIGKWHNSPEAFARSFSTGGPVFFGGMDDHWNVPVCAFHPDGVYPEARMHLWDSGVEPAQEIPKVYERVEAGKHSTDLFADAAIEFINRHDGDKPYFLSLAFMAPHDPRTTPKVYRDLYRDDEIIIPENFLAVHPFDNGELEVRDEHLEAKPRTRGAIRRHLADYYAMITHLDDRIGHIVEAVARKGNLERTIFILAGDNGLAIGCHGLMGKQNLYDHSIHVPLLWVGPGIVPGRISHSRCYLFDIFPTVCDLLGLETPSTVDGLSMAKYLMDGDYSVANGRTEHATMFFAYKDLQRCVMNDTRKLIKYSVPQPDGGGLAVRYQLFDRLLDPLELRDISGDPREQDGLEQLKSQLEAWNRSVGN